jgi:hypothetical protein
MAQRIVRHELVEIIIPANSTVRRFPLPDIANLRNSKIWGFQIWNTDQVTTSVISQNTLVSQALQKVIFLTLVNYGGKEFLKQAPANMFNTMQNDLSTGANQHELNYKSFVGQKVNYPKSYIESTATISTGSDTSFLFSIFYTLDKEDDMLNTFNNKS